MTEKYKDDAERPEKSDSGDEEMEEIIKKSISKLSFTGSNAKSTRNPIDE